MVKYCSVAQIASKWNLSERTVRDYCAKGKIVGAFLTGKTWNIPETAQRPLRKKHSKKIKNNLLAILRREKESKLSGGIYHRLQIDMTYNSNHIEGSLLTHEQTRYIFETNTIGISENIVNVDDIIETFKDKGALLEAQRLVEAKDKTAELDLILYNEELSEEYLAYSKYKDLPLE